MEQESKKTSEEWSKTYPMIIKDPDGWDRSNFEYSWHQELITKGEFALRAAMSTCVPRGVSFGILYKKISEWAAGVFGADRPVGPIVKKLHKEVDELEKAFFFLDRNWSEKDRVYSEIADCVILLMNLSNRMGLDYVGFTKVVESKFVELQGREWDKLPDGTFQHKASDPAFCAKEINRRIGDLSAAQVGQRIYFCVFCGRKVKGSAICHWCTDKHPVAKDGYICHGCGNKVPAGIICECQRHGLLNSGEKITPLDVLDPAHRCTICKTNWVDSDNGFDTCQECLSKI